MSSKIYPLPNDQPSTPSTVITPPEPGHYQQQIRAPSPNPPLPLPYPLKDQFPTPETAASQPAAVAMPLPPPPAPAAIVNFPVPPQPAPSGPMQLPPLPPPAYVQAPPYPGGNATTNSQPGPPGFQPIPPIQQQQQQTIYVGASRVAPPRYTVMRKTDDWIGTIVLSCIVLWLCGIIFGLIAFIFAVSASNNAHKHPKRAKCCGITSYVLSAVGIFIPIATIIIVCAVAFSPGGFGSQSTTSSLSCSSGYTVGGSCYKYQMYFYSSSSCSSAGGYYSGGYCYFTSSSCTYYVSGYCYPYRSASKTSYTCSHIDGYYDSFSGYCYYYSSSCPSPYYSINYQCYGYRTSSYNYGTCSSYFSTSGYYSSPYCYYY